MKKLILIGVTLGIVSLAKATPIPQLTYSINVGTISGPNSYIYNTVAALDPTQNYLSATLSFSGVKLTATGGDNTLNYDLLNVNTATTHFADTGTSTQTEGQDWFEHNSYNYDKIGASAKVFSLNQTQSWNETFSSTALADLLSDIKTFGSFDLGIDPNCTYNVGTITLTFTTTKKNISTPDQSMTVVLLGLSFVGLLALRRKLCLS
jgi:hypothetical protein